MNFFTRIKDGLNEYFVGNARHKDAKTNLHIHEAGGSAQQITNANVSNFVVKAVGQIDQSGNNDFTSPESDLGEIRDAVATDSYLKQAVVKYSQLIFKAGYSIVSDNDAAAQYIQQRFDMMSFETGTPIDILFQQVADDLVTYSNAFLIKSRVDTSLLGGIQAQGVLDTLPVGGYFRVDPTTMQIKRDKNGTIKNYQQQVGNDKKSYKPQDVIHIYMDKPGGAAFGTPRLAAALEDVKMLRKIEGNALKLVYRYSAPLLQMKVGLPEQGMRATNQDIKDARVEVEKLADDGIFITNEATEFHAIGVDGAALNLQPFLSYFESRVFSALALSPAMMGRGGAKQDADSMEEQVHDSVKFFQRTLQIFFENSIINELLMEGGYAPISNAQDKVHFQFNEINLETQVKMETHAMNLFQGNAIPFEEMRSRLGLYTDNLDESRLYANMIQQPNAIAQIQAKLGGSGTGSGTGSSSNSGKSAEASKPNGTAKNAMSPTNQHGTTSTPIKESADISLTEDTKENESGYRKKFGAIYKKYNTMRNDIFEDGAKAYLVMPLARDAVSDSLKRYTALEAEKGYKKAVSDAKEEPQLEPRTISAVLNSRIDKHLDKMFKDIQKKLKKAKTREQREAAFSSSEYRLRFLSEHVASKAYWYAYVKTAQALKIDQVYVDFNEGSNDKKEHSRIIHTNHFSLDDIPAFHPYCECKLGMKAGEKK